jgi:uncharacterized protein DUF1835
MVAAMLHVRCGDDILGKLEAAGLPGERLSWVDPVCEGPLPAGVEGAAWYAMRAAWLARRHRLEETEVAADLRAQDRALARAGEHEEVVLWFEHDLFDQSILVRLLAWWAAARPDAQLTLVDVEPLLADGSFIGLGQLEAEQLAPLFPGRREVTEAQLELATRAWGALRAPDPRAVEELARERAVALPHLAAALRRHLEELPWTGDGLSLLERRALEAVRDGARTPMEAFLAVQQREAAPWMGDTVVFAVLDDLARGPVALLRAGEDGSVGLLPAGARVLEGEDAALLRGGLDRWVGGVHLEGLEPAWRWDGERGGVVAP